MVLIIEHYISDGLGKAGSGLHSAAAACSTAATTATAATTGTAVAAAAQTGELFIGQLEGVFDLGPIGLLFFGENIGIGLVAFRLSGRTNQLSAPARRASSSPCASSSENMSTMGKPGS